MEIASRFCFLCLSLAYTCIVSAAPISSEANSTSNDLDDRHRQVEWQPNPSRRGTLNIIESCFFTIVACTWSIQRLNVPKGGGHGRFWLGRRMMWTVVAILAPEFILAQAIEHWRWVRECLKALGQSDYEIDDEKAYDPRNWWKWMKRWWKSEEPDDDGKITLKHCYYGNMGGFIATAEVFTIGANQRGNLDDDKVVGRIPVVLEELLTILDPELESLDDVEDTRSRKARRTELS